MILDKKEISEGGASSLMKMMVHNKALKFENNELSKKVVDL